MSNSKLLCDEPLPVSTFFTQSAISVETSSSSAAKELWAVEGVVNGNGNKWQSLRNSYEAKLSAFGIDEMPRVKEKDISRTLARGLHLPNVLANTHLYIQSQMNGKNTTPNSTKY